jgi:hypothetical protein
MKNIYNVWNYVCHGMVRSIVIVTEKIKWLDPGAPEEVVFWRESGSSHRAMLVIIQDFAS